MDLPPCEGIISDIGRDALVEVFRRVPFEDRLKTLPLVCKAWKDIALDPTCWRNVDMQPWFEKRAVEDFSWEFECEPVMEFLVKRVVDLSCGQLTELRTMYCTDAAMKYVAERSPSLTVLAFPDSELVSDEAAVTLAAKCPKLQELDLSDCYNLSTVSMEAFGRNCKSLVSLARNMLHRNSRKTRGADDDEAVAVSQNMPNLTKLELKKASITDVGARLLARGCTKLESLNLAACTSLSPDAVNDFIRFCLSLEVFVKPIIPRLHVNPKQLPHLLFSGIC